MGHRADAGRERWPWKELDLVNRADYTTPNGGRSKAENAAERLFKFFAGNQHRHVKNFGPAVQDEKKRKWKLNTKTIEGPATLKDWNSHLNPSQYLTSQFVLSIIPLLGDGTCWFACIDVDQYQLDLNKVCQTINTLKFPLLSIMSKNGGLHLFVFFKEPVRVERVIPVLHYMAIGLGFNKYEVFPTSTGEQKLTRGIGMPYGPTFDVLAQQNALSRSGNALTLEECLDAIDRIRITADELPQVPKEAPQQQKGREIPLALQAAIDSMGPYPGGDRSPITASIITQLRALGLDAEAIKTAVEGRGPFARYGGEKNKSLEDDIARIISKYDLRHPTKKGTASKITRPPPEFIGWRKGPAPRVEYLVDKMIKRRGTGIIGGQPKDGKSLIAANLSSAIITGQSFAGRLVMRPGGVLWLLNEGQDEIDDNIQEAVRAMGGTLDDQPFIRVEGAQHLQEPDAEEWLDDIIKEAKARLQKEYNVELVLVVIDTIISVGAYEDDNSRALTSAVMQKVRNVSMANDLFTLVVDHVGKDKKRGIMGSIAKVANADVVLLLDVDRKNGTVISRKMILHMMRGGAAGTVNHFSLKQTPENEHGDSFITVDWHGIEQISLSHVCNLLLRCIRECEDPGDLLHPKKDLRVNEDDVRNRFYKEYGRERDANRNAFNRAKAQAVEGGLIRVEKGLMWLV